LRNHIHEDTVHLIFAGQTKFYLAKCTIGLHSIIIDKGWKKFYRRRIRQAFGFSRWYKRLEEKGTGTLGVRYLGWSRFEITIAQPPPPAYLAIQEDEEDAST
jgi:hypothetical protein